MARIEIFPASEMEFSEVSFEGGKLAGTPVFYNSGREVVPVAMICVRDNRGQVVHRYVLRVSGSELKMSLQERSNPVLPAYEVPAEQLTPAPAATASPKKGS